MSMMIAAQSIERAMASLSSLMGQVVRGTSAGARVFEVIKHQPSIPIQVTNIPRLHTYVCVLM